MATNCSKRNDCLCQVTTIACQTSTWEVLVSVILIFIYLAKNHLFSCLYYVFRLYIFLSLVFRVFTVSVTFLLLLYIIRDTFLVLVYIFIQRKLHFIYLFCASDYLIGNYIINFTNHKFRSLFTFSGTCGSRFRYLFIGNL